MEYARVILLLAILAALNSLDVGPDKITIVPEQKGGPIGQEKLIEYTNIDKELGVAIAHDIAGSISQPWTRIRNMNDKIVAIAYSNMVKPPAAARLYFIEKKLDKWVLVDSGKMVIFDP